MKYYFNQYVQRQGMMKAQGQGQRQEELPGAMAARAQKGLEDLSHIEGQEGRPWGDTPRPR